MIDVAIFGGSFNPPHLAHVLAVTTVLSLHEMDAVVVVPTFRHPFAKALASYEERVKMCELGLGWLPRVEISRVEETLGGESRTLRTLEHLRTTHPDWSMRLVIGADLLLEAPRWHGFEDIKRIAPPLILGRVGVSHPEAPAPVLPDVSSTHVRDLIAQGAWAELGHLLPKRVLAYVRAHGLYRNASTENA